MKILKVGKRYEWPMTIPCDVRMKNGLFTGQYTKNGNALLITKNGEEWSVPEENCVLFDKKNS